MMKVLVILAMVTFIGHLRHDYKKWKFSLQWLSRVYIMSKLKNLEAASIDLKILFINFVFG